jgi:hypothetical protein
MKFHTPTKIIFGILLAMVIAAVVFLTVEYGRIKQEQQPNISQEIVVTVPIANMAVNSPLQISGKAQNTWFFEASFPVKVLDEDGSVLGVVHVMAISDWTTPGFVSFSGSLEFNQPKGRSGKLVFENDNPSGLVQNHKEFDLPIKFSVQNSAVQPTGTCSPDTAACKGNPELCMTEHLNKVCD